MGFKVSMESSDSFDELAIIEVPCASIVRYGLESTKELCLPQIHHLASKPCLLLEQLHRLTFTSINTTTCMLRCLFFMLRRGFGQLGIFSLRQMRFSVERLTIKKKRELNVYICGYAPIKTPTIQLSLFFYKRFYQLSQIVLVFYDFIIIKLEFL